MKIILRILINAIALWVTTLILPAIQISGGPVGLIIVAVIFGLVNAFIGPIIKILSLPITLLTLGLFALVINAFLLLLTSKLAGSSMNIAGEGIEKFLWAFVGAIIISLVSMVLGWFLPDKR